MRIEAKPYVHPNDVFAELQPIGALASEALSLLDLYQLGLADREELERGIDAGIKFCDRVRSDIEKQTAKKLRDRLGGPKTYRALTRESHQEILERNGESASLRGLVAPATVENDLEGKEEIFKKIEHIEASINEVKKSQQAGDLGDELKERLEKTRQYLDELRAPYFLEAFAKLSESEHSF